MVENNPPIHTSVTYKTYLQFTISKTLSYRAKKKQKEYKNLEKCQDGCFSYSILTPPSGLTCK